jgi:acetyltransferase-like isoleucine patch superfamily enzyme
MKKWFKGLIVNSLFFKSFIEFCVYYIERYKKDQQHELLRQQITINDSCVVQELRVNNHLQDKNKITISAHTMIIGAQLLIYKHGGEITIGEYCYIGEGARIWSARKVSIGDRVLISHGVNIHDNNSHPLNSELRHKDFVGILSHGLPEKADYNEQEVVIEDDVWLGFNSTVLKGVRIGQGAVIGACSVVVKDVPANAIVVGNPGCIIGYVK